jgi:hypothetical protein
MGEPFQGSLTLSIYRGLRSPRLLMGCPLRGRPRVFTAEHLAAICLQVGRLKDHDRVIRFVEAGVLEPEVFEPILQRHDLMNRWLKFQETYLNS